MKATISGRASASIKKREVTHKDIEETEEVDLDPGDGLAKVSHTRGFKHWMSWDDRDNHIGKGMSVEATISVTLTCHQSVPRIEQATLVAGKIAEDIADVAIGEMDQYLDNYMER